MRVPDAARIALLRDQLAAYEQQLGPEEDDAGFQARRNRRNARKWQPPRGGGSGPSPFAGGRIRAGGSKLRADRAYIRQQLNAALRAREEARRQGYYVPDEMHRPQGMQWPPRRFDGDGGGGAAGAAGAAAAV